MDSASIITSMDNPLQHFRSVRVGDLPPNQKSCSVCDTPWGSPRDANGTLEYPVLLTCGCVAGALCLERAFCQSPRCPLCNTTIRVVAGVNAPLKHNTKDQLRQLELSSGIDDWPLPSSESRSDVLDRAGMWNVAEQDRQLQYQLDVLNECHGTFLSMREFDVCISLIDYRLGTSTSPIQILDAFLRDPLFDQSRWKRSAELREYMSGSGTNLFFQRKYDLADRDLKDLLMMVNLRAGTSFLLDELELVVSLVNYVQGRGIGLLDVLGLRDEGQYGREDSGQQLVDQDLVGPFRNLDIRVGSRNAVEDLGDVFSQATL